MKKNKSGAKPANHDKKEKAGEAKGGRTTMAHSNPEDTRATQTNVTEKAKTRTMARGGSRTERQRQIKRTNGR